VVDLQLAVGQASQTVTVSAEASQVETTNASVSSLVNSTQMRELPLNGRNFEQLILLAPGVSTYPRAEAPHSLPWPTPIPSPERGRKDTPTH
jgi:hypothetical protein